ncbi:MAG: Uncharacterised protein [Synechococcus sp. MIT S9220]|nr:MAG: Uncharacterised protein [Synechococcus sp. MIT S9220]
MSSWRTSSISRRNSRTFSTERVVAVTGWPALFMRMATAVPTYPLPITPYPVAMIAVRVTPF